MGRGSTLTVEETSWLGSYTPYIFSCFPFGFKGRMWDLIVSVPDYCLSFYFPSVPSGHRELITFPIDSNGDPPGL